jgi:hypothetical protein
MEALKRNYKCTLSHRQALAHFDKEKPTYRGYTEHLNYLLQVTQREVDISTEIF